MSRGGPSPQRRGKDAVERPRDAGQIERVDEQDRIPGLPVPHEPPKLLLVRELALGRLLLERTERSKFALGGNDLLHADGADGPDQLVLEICDAHVKAELFHVGAGEVRAEPRSLETVTEVDLLSGVAETREPEVEPRRPELFQESPDRLRTSDRHDGNALGLEVASAALGERFKGALVAYPFDQHDRTWDGRRLHDPAR